MDNESQQLLTPVSLERENPSDAPLQKYRRPFFWALAVLSLSTVWGPVIHLLGAQWNVFDQYHYGWAVPLLCVYLAGLRLGTFRGELRRPHNGRVAIIVVTLFGILLFPTRVLQEGNPLWRLASYALVAEAVVITLALVYLLGGLSLLRNLAFPIGFFFVAVPWPTPVEVAVVQTLTQLNTSAVIEIMNLAGVPAVAAGNVIELATGKVGVNEACSGIRSLQATLMISLFFGEMFRQSVLRRIALIGCGFGIATLLNMVRTSILVTVAARQGGSAIDKWHDPTGISLLVLCFILLWLTATLFGRKQKLPVTVVEETGPRANPSIVGVLRGFLRNRQTSMACTLALVLSLGSVAGTEAWFRSRERKTQQEPELQIQLPKNKSHFREIEVTKEVRSQLQYDRGVSAGWSNQDGTHWQLFYFRWDPGVSINNRMRVHLAKRHRPDVCLPAGGFRLEREYEPTVLNVNGTVLPFRTYRFDANDTPVFVFHCIREDGTPKGASGNVRSSHASRFSAAWNGNRGLGQRVIEIIIWGVVDLPEAQASLRRELPALLGSPD
jgi:exosortase